MREREETGSGSLEELAIGIEEGMRSYNQKELAEADPNGIDFTNQYTQYLVHNKEVANGA